MKYKLKNKFIKNKYKIFPIIFAVLFITIIGVIFWNRKEENLDKITYVVPSSINDFKSLKKTNEISYLMNDYDSYYENYADVIRVSDGYIYAKNLLEDEVFSTYIVKSDFSGNEIWSYKYDNSDSYRYNMVLLNDKIYIAANQYGTLILNASDGSLYKHDSSMKYFDIQIFNNNLMLISEESLILVDPELAVLDTYESSSLSTSEYTIYFGDYYFDSNNIYILSTKENIADSSYSSLIYTLDLELNYVNELAITAESDSGFFATYGYYYDYLNFIKTDNEFYQVGFDLHKIDEDGNDTLLVDYDLFVDNQYDGVFDILIFDEFLITLDVKYTYDFEGYWDDVDIFLSVRNKEFEIIKQYKVNDNFIQYYAIPESMNYVDGKIVVKWYDWATYENYISEFEFSNDSDMCTVVSGTGSDIGDEIKCGEEEFYVLENDGVNVKMMGKYNLLVGENYEKFLLDEEYVTSDFNDMYDYLYSLPSLKEKLSNGYVLNKIFYSSVSDSETSVTTYTLSGALIYKSTQYKTGTVFCESDVVCTEDELLLLAKEQGYFGEKTYYYFESYGVENENLVLVFEYAYEYGGSSSFVIFDEPVSTRREALINSEVQEKLSKGYAIEYITLSDGTILGVEFDEWVDDYHYVLLDESVDSIKEMLNSSEVQEYLNSGYSFYSSLYENDGTFLGAIVQYYSDNLITVVMENSYTAYEDLLKSDELIPYYENGYLQYSSRSIDGEYPYVEFLKYDDRDYKTILFDTTLSTLVDLYNRDDVQEYLNQGYDFYAVRTTSSSYSCSANAFCKYYHFGVILVKYDYYEYTTIIFDTPVTNSDDVRNNQLVQDKISEGYSISEFLSSRYRLYVNNADGSVNIYTTYPYFGAALRKSTGVGSPSTSVSGDYNYIPYIMEKLEPFEVRQDETAIGAHGSESGAPEPFEYGVVAPYDVWGSPISDVYATGYQDYDYYTDYPVWKYYHSYYSTLINDGFNVLDVNSITVSEINDLVYDVTGSELPLEEWYNTAEEEGDDYVTENGFYILGSIKDQMPEEYSWLWSTTYWTRTYDETGYWHIYFVDTLGDLCMSDYCQGAIGAGLRPVVTMSLSSIEFNVTTSTDGNGEVVASQDTATVGDTITFTVTPNEGYIIDSITVTDELGNVIVYTDYSFTMPSADVNIDAKFQEKIYFEPQIEINPSNVTNAVIGENIHYNIVISNPYSFDLTDVIVKVDNLGAQCTNTNCTKIDDYTFKFSSIKANYQDSLYLVYTPLEFGYANITAEILEAYAESPNFLNEEKDYIATAVASTKAGLEICNVLDGTGNGSVNQYHLKGYYNSVVVFDHWIVLNDNSCTKISLDTGVTYQLTQLDKKEYTLESVTGLINGNGVSFTLEPKTYKITFNNIYEKKSYFHSWDRKENDIGIYSEAR